MAETTTKTKRTSSRSKTNKKPATPDFSKETYMHWYESMYTMRKFEEKAAQMYGKQKIKGFCHLYIGQEACVAGAVTALTKDDKWITAYRDHAHPIGLGTEPKYVMAELFARVTGVSRGKGGSMHMFDKERNFFGGHGIVGGQIPLGAGIAFAEQYKKTKNLCMTYMGDGAVRQGAFHESLNIAMTFNLPCIFVIENNGYAMGTSVNRTSNVNELYTLAEAYDMPSEPVNAMNVEEVHKAVAKAAKRARNGKGPTLLEFKTYRYKGHSISDPAKYRTKEELQAYRQQDPVLLLKTRMVRDEQITEDEFLDLDKQIKKICDDAVAFAEESEEPPIESLYNDVIA